MSDLHHWCALPAYLVACLVGLLEGIAWIVRQTMLSRNNVRTVDEPHVGSLCRAAVAIGGALVGFVTRGAGGAAAGAGAGSLVSESCPD